MHARAWKAIAVLFVTDAVLAGATAALLVGDVSHPERQPALVIDAPPAAPNPGPAAGSVPVEEARLAPAVTDAPSSTTAPPTTASKATTTLPAPPSVTAAAPRSLTSTTTTTPVDTTPTTTSTSQPAPVTNPPGGSGP